ncbi:Tau class glutathione S-transferase [Dorcoceras hygrometricum]|uniref:Tau class glutathione S-transferase n=1 Tax=Dorcoceras hygrometricum TaxID=472368 RepID=A0A2Z7DFL4_9LAMI|nr:Tau class glutathione S-transferase [Dorcoceras hygrometricum]
MYNKSSAQRRLISHAETFRSGGSSQLWKIDFINWPSVGNEVKYMEDKMPPRKNRLQNIGENSSTKNLYRGSMVQGLTTSQIAQLVTTIVEQVLAHRPGIQLAVGPQPLWLRNHNFGLAQRIMVKRLATSPHDPLGITDSACKNQLVVVNIRGNHESSTCVTLNDSGIQLAVGPQPLWLRNHNFGLAQRIMVKRLATSPHDPLGITDSACKNQLVVVSVQYGPFNTYIPIRSTTIGKSRVAKDPIAMHTSWRSNSDIASVTRVSMTFRVVRTNQYNQDLGLIHSTNGNHLESLNEGSSIDHQVTIYLHAQNITMFPINETWYFASQILVSSSGGLILILTAQSTRN